MTDGYFVGTAGFKRGDQIKVTSFVDLKWWEIWLRRWRERKWHVYTWRTVERTCVVTYVTGEVTAYTDGSQ